MEDGGFTVVLPTGKTGKTTTDGVNSMPIATKPYEPKEKAPETLMKRKKKEFLKTDFYRFQQKNLKKDSLLDLKKGFEKDLMRLQQLKRVKQVE